LQIGDLVDGGAHSQAKSNGYQPQPQPANPDDDIPF
jgi:hypothetical protein